MNPSESESDSAAKRPSARRPRWSGYLLLLLIGVLGFFVIRAAIKLNATPTYWSQHQTFLQDTPPEQLQELAQDIQSRSLREWSYPIGDGDGVRTVRYAFDEVNAWLATRLKPLLENQDLSLPAEIGEFMLTQRGGQLVLAFDYESSTLGPRIASLYFGFEAADGQPLAARIQSARAGEQPLLLRYLVKQITDQLDSEDASLQEKLVKLGKKEFVPLPVIPVDDHREATILKIEVEPEGIDLLIRVSYHDR